MTDRGISPALLARLDKHETQHKYDHGHLLVLAGGVGRGGAARLAARAALRIGAGLVTLAPPPAALIENAVQLNAIMVQSLRDGDQLAALLEDPRITGLCLGPGLGLTDRTREMVRVALASKRPVVLDADALSAFAEEPGALFALLHPRAVLTPHAGEFARLFPLEAEEMRQAKDEVSKRRLLHSAALRAHAVVLLKGPVTRIADPAGGQAEVDSTGSRAAPWLATAGSGDVLAGLIAGLMVRGFSTMEAAQLGGWLHAEAARRFGPGLIAEDLPELLPGILRAVLR